MLCEDRRFPFSFRTDARRLRSGAATLSLVPVGLGSRAFRAAPPLPVLSEPAERGTVWRHRSAAERVGPDKIMRHADVSNAHPRDVVRRLPRLVPLLPTLIVRLGVPAEREQRRTVFARAQPREVPRDRDSHTKSCILKEITRRARLVQSRASHPAFASPVYVSLDDASPGARDSAASSESGRRRDRR